jgi:hypothetical protein
MFLRILIAAWVLYLLTLAMLFRFPDLVIHHLLRGHGRVLGYALGVLVLTTGVYKVTRLYRAGMTIAKKQ